MSSMKQTDKKRSPANTQTRRPSRVESRETKLQQEKSIKTLRSNEAKTNRPTTRVNSGNAANNRNKNTKVDQVHEKLVTDKVSRFRQIKPSTDLDKEQNDDRDESDSETVTDSTSSSGDSRATEDEKVDTASIVSHESNISKNVKGLKVRPKSPSTPSSISSEVFDGQDFGESKEMNILDEVSNGVQTDGETPDVVENTKDEEKEALNLIIAQMEMRIGKLEDELREVAALEVSLYSAVQDHASSTHELHMPAHRLSKLYIHAFKHSSQEKRDVISKSIVSGLVMISNSCGNDVPRLTFWWSNIIVLREIIAQTFETKQTNDPDLTSELQKIESGIFSRIVESIWLQTLMPNMLKKERTGKLMGPSGDQQQNNFSINIWENALHDAFKRLCPVRAVGHECSCLPVLAKRVMEQCVARLDVAMFNAILRESTNEIPTDHVSDPITECTVLPIPAGDLSFGSGAQLQKAVGTWSKWLNDRFSVDTNADNTANENNTITSEVKWFDHLNSLSHLLMVPKDMLTDKSIRAEVCPLINLMLLKRILSNFTPDEFCPDPVPSTILEEINSESMIESRLSEDDSGSFPYASATTVYKPPSSISKQYTSHVEPVNGNISSYVGANASIRVFRQTLLHAAGVLNRNYRSYIKTSFDAQKLEE
ncbi:hypothetical protein CTI12_AA212600 [Artemisia annua]|uniref:Dilute domain-containing protein n=1 Tax=Artemisia annua TaxID=35608 RepID=A0A2U1NYM7_ARTAN|nr:hypothetical protein CTI12_AA212600 [Artemisia annua]